MQTKEYKYKDQGLKWDITSKRKQAFWNGSPWKCFLLCGK